MMYNERVEQYFFAPNHVGILDKTAPFTAHYRGGELGRGDVFDFYLLCDAVGLIKKARFQAYGNPFFIAAAEWTCQQLEGSFIADHPRFNYRLLIQRLALPKTRYPVAIQIEEGYNKLVKRMKETMMNSEVMQHTSQDASGITLSESALRHMLHYLSTQPNAQGIRLSVKMTGCSGRSYVVESIQTPTDKDRLETIEKGAQILQLYIDKASYPYLKGTHIDYIREGLNYKFVFNNPNQTGQCGCGESFTVDE